MLLKEYTSNGLSYSYYEVHNGMRVMHGDCILYYLDGSKRERQSYRHGDLNGLCEAWFVGGAPRMKAYFYNNKRHGEFWRRRGRNNEPDRLFYINGKQHPYIKMDDQEKLLFQIEHPEFRFIED